MPKEGISLYFTIQDGASNVLTSIGDKTKALDKETQSLAQAQAALAAADKPLLDRQAELSMSLAKLKSDTKAAQKEWEKYGDELHKNIYANLLREQGEAQEELRKVNSQLKENQKTYNEYQETLRKGGISESGGKGDDNSLASFGRKLLTGQLGQMASQAISGYLGDQLTSAIGTPDANLISGAARGLISGASAGAIAGPWGALIGGIVGAGSGALSGYTSIFSQQDEAFKDYYNSLYENAMAERERAFSSGSSIASQRETDRISFSTLFGDTDTAERYLRDLVKMSNTTPFLYDDLTAMSKTLATYGYGDDSILPMLQTIGDAGAALGMAVSDMNTVATALGRMQSSDKASLEYLNMLNERGIGAVGMLADAKGVSQKDMYSMISKGEISGRDAVQIIMAALQEQFSGSMLTQSQTYSGLTSTLEGLKQELDNASGEGYNELRTKGLREEIDAYGGALGDALKELNTLSGQTQAFYENLSKQYNREALGAVLTGTTTTVFDESTAAELQGLREKYVEARSAYDDAVAAYGEGSEQAIHAAEAMQNLKDKAETVAQNAYESSEAVKTLHDSQMDLIDATRELSAKFDGWSWKYTLGVEKSKGRAAAAAVMDGESILAADAEMYDDTLRRDLAASGIALTGGRRNAFGLDRVPYDGYAAILHEGERVLTAQEARSQDEGGRGNITVTIPGASFYGTARESADEIIELVVRGLEQAVIARGR